MSRSVIRTTPIMKPTSRAVKVTRILSDSKACKLVLRLKCLPLKLAQELTVCNSYNHHNWECQAIARPRGVIKQVTPQKGTSINTGDWACVDVTLCDKNNAHHETTTKSWEDDKNPFRFGILQVGAVIKVSALETDTYKNKPYATVITITTGGAKSLPDPKGDQSGNTTERNFDQDWRLVVCWFHALW